MVDHPVWPYVVGGVVGAGLLIAGHSLFPTIMNTHVAPVLYPILLSLLYALPLAVLFVHLSVKPSARR